MITLDDRAALVREYQRLEAELKGAADAWYRREIGYCLSAIQGLLQEIGSRAEGKRRRREGRKSRRGGALRDSTSGKLGL